MTGLEQELLELINQAINGKYTGKLKVTVEDEIYTLFLYLNRELTPKVLSKQIPRKLKDYWAINEISECKSCPPPSKRTLREDIYEESYDEYKNRAEAEFKDFVVSEIKTNKPYFISYFRLHLTNPAINELEWYE